MMRFGSALALVLAISGTAAAQTVPTAQDVVGLWKRLGNKETHTERYYNITLKPGGGLTGTLLNPPFDTMTCSLDLKVISNRVEGQCNWTEGKYKTYTKWAFTISPKGDRLLGQSELIDWEDGKVYDRRWVDYTMVRVKKDDLVADLKKLGKKVDDFAGALKVLGYQVEGLVTEGKGEEAYGDAPKDLAVVAGGYAGPGGAWAATVAGKRLLFDPIGHHDKYQIEVTDVRGTLKGSVTLPSGRKTKIELGWDADEKSLSGRVEWLAGPYGAWAPIKLTRLQRTEGGAAKAEKPTASSGPLTGVWKRDDGLYLRVREEAGDTLGVLCKQDGKPLARIRFEQKSGIWVGTANWKGWESTWELGVDGDTLAGRCQWADLADGKVVARGWGGRTFTRLKRVN